MINKITFLLLSISLVVHLSAGAQSTSKTPKAVFIIVDGIPYDVIQKLNPPTLAAIAKSGGFTQAHVGGDKGAYNETPTISAPGYIDLLTGTWGNKHNVWDNDIADPNYNYWNIFRIAETVNPKLKTAVFSTWLDNRTKLIGEGLEKAGGIKLDHSFDGLELDTVKYPHDKGAQYILNIDEAVSTDAAKYITENGPDLSWVYLEFTDDMGHRYGDSPQFYESIKSMDNRVKKIWDAIQLREKKFKEDWLIVITTDHGRDAATGKDHGGQSDRERTTWITTNAKNLNSHFKENPGIVDILPSITKHLRITMPDNVKKELDGVSFMGDIDVTDFHAERTGDSIKLTWKNKSKKNTKAEILVAETNKFKQGGEDEYKKVGEVSLQEQTFTFPATQSTFYKILIKTSDQYSNAWIKG